jgi:hypothetical protein
VASRSESRKARLAALLTGFDGAVDEERFAALKTALAPVSESYLRRLLRESGAPLAPLVEGVVLKSSAHLERTLLALAAEYEMSDVSRRRTARSLVIEAKDRLRWSLKKAPTGEKGEHLLWLMTWLENPDAFPLWVRIRKRQTTLRL